MEDFKGAKNDVVEGRKISKKRENQTLELRGVEGSERRGGSKHLSRGGAG